MGRRRGNPNWGRRTPTTPAIATEFEIIVRRLHLIPELYASSLELKRWCERNRNRCYVPEWLLQEWGMAVEISYGHYAALTQILIGCSLIWLSANFFSGALSG
jgi:hypothetical protein